jgi:hypothetical protein
MMGSNIVFISVLKDLSLCTLLGQGQLFISHYEIYFGNYQ